MKEREGSRIDIVPFNWIQGCLKQMGKRASNDPSPLGMDRASSSEANDSDEDKEIEDGIGASSHQKLVELKRSPRSFDGNAAPRVPTELSLEYSMIYSRSKELFTVFSHNAAIMHPLIAQDLGYASNDIHDGSLLDLPESSSRPSKDALPSIASVSTFDDLTLPRLESEDFEAAKATSTPPQATKPPRPFAIMHTDLSDPSGQDKIEVCNPSNKRITVTPNKQISLKVFQGTSNSRHQSRVHLSHGQTRVKSLLPVSIPVLTIMLLHLITWNILTGISLNICQLTMSKIPTPQ